MGLVAAGWIEEVNISDPDFSDHFVHGMTEIAAGVVAVWVSDGQVDGDATVLFSGDGVRWREVPVEGLGGLGVQWATDVLVMSNGDLLIAGADNGAPVVWKVPGEALG
jgi:hypothetical protein